MKASDLLPAAKRLTQLADNYVLQRFTTGYSTSSFWYSPEFAAVYDEPSLARYLNCTPSPFYLMDYRAKLRYRNKTPEGIIFLPYSPPVGPRINPEAAFQYALGHHDQWLRGSEASLETFLQYSKFFRERQSEEGHFYYDFDWYECKAPWYSALSQSRGVSVMLRAWLLTKDTLYLDAAEAGTNVMERPVADRGCRALLESTGSHYYEEYPDQRHAVLNGFMSSLFGLWEMGHWAQRKSLAQVFTEGVASLERMLPLFTTEWWSLYDLSPGPPNVHSPRYHCLVIEYLKILATISGSAVLAQFGARYQQMNTLRNRARALRLKLQRKLTHR